jgi:hypothetical protein
MASMAWVDWLPGRSAGVDEAVEATSDQKVTWIGSGCCQYVCRAVAGVTVSVLGGPNVQVAYWGNPEQANEMVPASVLVGMTESVVWTVDPLAIATALVLTVSSKSSGSALTVKLVAAEVDVA